jgi:2-phosphoglycerate kinase
MNSMASSQQPDLKKIDWRVLLIGGSAGVGKTTAAQELARHLSIPLLLADDIRLALQAVTTSAQQPVLHRFLTYRPEQWLDPETIRDDWIAVSEAMLPALRIIMAHHITVPGAGPIIIEGDSILPPLALPRAFSELEHPDERRVQHHVRAVIVREPLEEQILRNLRARGRGFEQRDEAEQRAFARASLLYGNWLETEARAHALPVLLSRPHDTLARRILDSTASAPGNATGAAGI